MIATGTKNRRFRILASKVKFINQLQQAYKSVEDQPLTANQQSIQPLPKSQTSRPLLKRHLMPLEPPTCKSKPIQPVKAMEIQVIPTGRTCVQSMKTFFTPHHTKADPLIGKDSMFHSKHSQERSSLASSYELKLDMLYKSVCAGKRKTRQQLVRDAENKRKIFETCLEKLTYGSRMERISQQSTRQEQ